ncbi:MAG: Mth938-like domain-containing protein [Pseudomonadota bacterium]|nr:Mth938-like domain-containing protein [Pseudomonadota bacterium]MEC8280654.1 Mth938-like domain-containing protein [Pseudomonadota bacterium]MEC8388610.1 Mth938-like domain-containing protein [Pseudomonadota bacterium]
MDVTPMVPEGLQVVTGYGDGGFTIGEQRHQGAVIVVPEAVLAWRLANPAIFTVDDFAPLWQLVPKPEVVLIGCGARGRFIPPALRDGLKAQGLVCDAMDTGAACRTYNVLLSESRRVAAALLPVD